MKTLKLIDMERHPLELELEEEHLLPELGPFDGPWPHETELEARMRELIREHLEEDARVHACEPAGHVDVPAEEVCRIERERLGQRPTVTGTPLPAAVEVRFGRRVDDGR